MPDRAIEAAARAVYATAVAPGEDWDRQAARNMVEALASAGLQITDQEDVLTEDEIRSILGEEIIPITELNPRLRKMLARRLSGATDA